MSRIIVIGAGIGGLTTAASLARAGEEVTVLEAHIYPGGCAGTFYHQGYRFDAGATLAAGFDRGGIWERLGSALGIQWPIEPVEAAMRVHLSDGAQVTRWTDTERWQAERRVAFGSEAEPFWRWQEATAGMIWQVAQRGVPWPPVSRAELAAAAGIGLDLARAWPQKMPGLLADALRPVSAHLPRGNARLKTFVDGQLLISAQATAAQANALYGAAALDLPRHSVAYLRGGLGTLGDSLAEAVRRQGGQVHYRQRVTRVLLRDGRPFGVETKRGQTFPADTVIFNLPPWDAQRLLSIDATSRPNVAGRTANEQRTELPEETAEPWSTAGPPADGWGAFVVYAGVDSSALPDGLCLHQQVLAGEPLGEGNSVFLSFSSPADAGRAPAGQRTLTLSTHTRLGPWWALFDHDREGYEARKQVYCERVLEVAERAVPGLRKAIRFALPGTPVTFQRFTHRSRGWVGGFPQTSLLRAHGPVLGPGLRLTGDSIFPGQSTPAVALGGLRVAAGVLAQVTGRRREAGTVTSRARQGAG